MMLLKPARECRRAWICAEAANEELLSEAMFRLTKTSGWTYARMRGGEAVGT